MTIKINDVIIPNADFILADGHMAGTLSFDTDESLDAIEERYSGKELKITRLDDFGNLYDEWYLRSLTSINFTFQEGKRTVELRFEIGKVSQKEAADITSALEDSEMSILEIATYCATLEQTVDEHSKQLGQNLENNEKRCRETDERVNSYQQSLAILGNRLNAFADRIADIENFLGAKLNYSRQH